MLLKLCVYGAHGYWRDSMNRFDGVIVLASVVDVVVIDLELVTMPVNDETLQVRHAPPSASHSPPRPAPTQSRVR